MTDDGTTPAERTDDERTTEEKDEALDRVVLEGRPRLHRDTPDLLATGAVAGIEVAVGVLAYFLVLEATGTGRSWATSSGVCSSRRCCVWSAAASASCSGAAPTAPRTERASPPDPTRPEPGRQASRLRSPPRRWARISGSS